MTNDIRKFLETVTKFDFAGEKTGQKPGDQWRGKDANPPGKKLVGGSAEESIVRELDKHVQETNVERKLKKDFEKFDGKDWADWDEKIKRVKQRAQQGELVTVWDKEKRVYKNVPKSEIKEYQNRQDQDAQVTSPPSPDASQTAIDQVQDKIFARDVEDETVEEQTPTTTPPASAAQQPFKFTPDQEKWLGGANRQDPDILKRMPGPKPGVDYFAGQDDQARAKTLNIGRSNLNTIKGAVGAQQDAPEVFPTKPMAAPAVTAPVVKPFGTPTAQTRPVVVDEPKKTAIDPDAFKKVPQQTLKVDAPVKEPSSAVAQPKPAERTTWQGLAKLNPNIKDPNKIYPGQEIKLPDGTAVTVRKGDTLSGIAQRYRQSKPAAPAEPTGAITSPIKTPLKPVPQTIPKISGKAASQLEKGREYRARQAAKQDNTNLGGNAADPKASGKAASQLEKGREYRAGQAAKAEPGVTATADVGVSQGGVAAAFGDLKKREDGNWYFPGGVKVTRPSVIAAAEKAAVQTSPAPTSTASGTAKQTPTTTAKNFKPMPSYILNQIPGVESSNNPKAIGGKGETGAWQTMAGTLKDPGYGVKPARDSSPEEAARVGRDYANAMYNRYRDPAKALAAYNAGPGAVDRAIRTAAEKGGDWKQYIPKSTRDSYLTKYDLKPPTRVAAKAGTTAESLMADYQKFVTEYGNQQNPDTQATSGDTPESDAEAELKRQRMDKRVSQGTLGGLSSVLPPGTNTMAAASGLTKMVDQKPLTPQEQMAISPIMPLVARAAEEPSTSASLKTALGKAGMLIKLGKQ